MDGQRLFQLQKVPGNFWSVFNSIAVFKSLENLREASIFQEIRSYGGAPHWFEDFSQFLMKNISICSYQSKLLVAGSFLEKYFLRNKVRSESCKEGSNNGFLFVFFKKGKHDENIYDRLPFVEVGSIVHGKRDTFWAGEE